VGHKLRVPQSEENDIMKKTISMYWPLAVFVPFASAAYMYVSSESASPVSQSPLGASQLTAELARTVSYGLVGDDSAAPVKPMRAVTSVQASEAS
jgi:hypothetical protein